MTDIAQKPASARIPWIDVAKGLGIGLVFYGHFVERFINEGVEVAELQMKWVYCFHMPLFFLLSGLVYKDRGLKFDAFLKRQMLSRLLPAWAFNFIGVLLWLAIAGGQGAAGYVGEHGWVETLRYAATRFGMETLQGRPTFNILMWFLICLFTAELGQFALRRALQKNWQYAVSILAFAGLTYVISAHRELVVGVLQGKLDWWHISSAIGAIVFYQVGILLQRLGWLVRKTPISLQVVLTLVFLAITVLTYNRNFPPGYKVVFLAHGAYGDARWFFLSAFAGIGLVIYASQLLMRLRVLSYVGTITLGLMCLNGIMHEFMNAPLAAWIMGCVGQQHVFVFTLVCLAGTTVSLVAAIPVAWFMDRYLPFLFGRRFARPKLAQKA